MIWFYVAMTIFGVAFAGPMIFGGLGELAGDLDADAGGLDVGDADVLDVEGIELDADGTPIDAPGDDSIAVGAGGSMVGDTLAGLLSFRSVVFGSAFFGIAGTIFTLLDYASAVTLLSALLVGGVAAVTNSLLFSALRRSSVDSNVTQRTLTGRAGAVVLPIEPGRRGRVRISLGGQPQFLVARHADERSTETFGRGAPIVVVAMENGTALVASLAELET